MPADPTIKTPWEQAMRETIDGQGLSMVAMGKELREKDEKIKALEAEVALERRALDFLAEAQNNTVPSLPLSERWRKLNDEELRAELVRFFHGWGNTQITRLEAEVGRLRTEAVQLTALLDHNTGTATAPPAADHTVRYPNAKTAAESASEYEQTAAADHTERARENLWRDRFHEKASQIFGEWALRHTGTAATKTEKMVELITTALIEESAAAERAGAEKMRERAAYVADQVQERAALSAQEIKDRYPGLNLDRLREVDNRTAGQRHAANEIASSIRALRHERCQRDERWDQREETTHDR